MTLRLGTRGSQLAMTQSGHVAEAITAATGRQVELVPISTQGDRSTAPLATFGGVGVFVAAVRDAVKAGDVDFAVHSLKDLPTAPEEGLTLGAIPVRENPADVLISRDGLRLDELPEGSVIGTGSPRRISQILGLGRGLQTAGLRGNVDTRIATVGVTNDAILLARAGLARLGRTDVISDELGFDVMLPAPGQGALALECRSDDTAMISILALLDDEATRAAVTAERALLATLEAGCSAPVGALADVDTDLGTIRLEAVVAHTSGDPLIRKSASSTLGQAHALGVELAHDMLAAGADQIMDQTLAGRTRKGTL